MGRASLLIVLGFIVIFGMVRINIDKTSESASANSSEYAETIIARNVVNGATEYGLSVFSNSGFDTSYWSSDFLGGSFTADFNQRGGDTTRLTVVATFEGVSYTNIIYIIATYEFLPNASGGASVEGESGAMTFSIDSAVVISGVDTNIDGTPGPGPDLPAFTVSTSQDSANLAPYAGNLTGGSEVVPPDTTVPTVNERITHYATIADFSLTGGIHSNVTWGSESNPVVVYSNAHMVFEGTTAGYGILAIDGSLKMENDTRWYGIVLIHNDDAYAALAAEGLPQIYGSLMMSADSGASTVMEGTASIFYSTEALEIAITAFTEATANNGGGGGMVMKISDTIWYE